MISSSLQHVMRLTRPIVSTSPLSSQILVTQLSPFFSYRQPPAEAATSTTTSSSSSLRLFSTSTRIGDDALVSEKSFDEMSNEELADTSTIPGWDLIHSPPRKFPRGALIGTVVSDKMQKTVNVAVDRYRIVPKIRKRVKYTRKFFAHDEAEVASVGDVVMITPCHRISKHKHFMLREIIRPHGQL